MSPRIGITAAVERVEQAAASLTDFNSQGFVADEEDFTSRLLDRIAQAFQEPVGGRYRWNARVLTRRGPGAEERTLGADFVGVLSVEIVGQSTRKGFLAQAKRLRNSYLPKAEAGRLLSQCRRMLEFTPDSFVFLYSRDGVHVVPAVDVVATDGTRPRSLYRHTVGSFFHEHFRCFIGDPRIQAVDQATLAELAPTGAMRALVVSVTEGPS